MSMIYKLWKYVTDMDYRFLVNANHGFCDSMRDDEYLRRMYKAMMGHELDLRNPQLFTEKLQWLKLYDRKPVYTRMVDKYEAKKYIEERVGKKYVIPTLGVWDSFDEIQFNKLPQKFVLKATHDSGSYVICLDKDKFDYNYAKRLFDKCLRKNYYYCFREWPYKDVRPRIIAEQLLDGGGEDIVDYKFYSFNGNVKALCIISGRFMDSGKAADFFNDKFEKIDMRLGAQNSDIKHKKPVCFDEMKKIASLLSKGIPELRVDFYEINNKAYVGEMTFFDDAGFVKFDPEKWDKIFGSWVDLDVAETDHSVF